MRVNPDCLSCYSWGPTARVKEGLPWVMRVLHYIPVISAIALMVMANHNRQGMRFHDALRGKHGEDNRALAVRSLIVMLSLGPLLLLIDLIGTIVKAALGYFPKTYLKPKRLTQS